MLIQAHPTLFRSFLIAHEEHLGQIQCHKVAGTVTRTVREGFLERDRGGEQRATPQRLGVRCSEGPTLELALGDPKSGPASCQLCDPFPYL